jgi:hypothetical protein
MEDGSLNIGGLIKHDIITYEVFDISLLFLFTGCINYHSKKDYKYTYNLCKHQPECACQLYADGYLVFGMGALGSDVYSEYLTDSSMFRVYTGTVDEYDERMIYACKGDSIYVEKRTNKGYAREDWGSFKVLDRKVYSLKDIKRKHIFE